MAGELKICVKGSRGGIFLPAFGDHEQEWPKEVRVVAYGVALLYFFLGISVVSDMFMEAIENITTQKQRVRSKIKEGKWITVYRWNATVANLTLMALGSSAPEILLSLVELVGDDMHSGNLGPSTVLGSAAFNLFVIVAVCVSAIPSGKVRYIQARMVFAVTAVYSLFAYIWLLLIVEYISPGRIEIWEGLATMAMLPLFVFNSFLVDKYEFSKLEEQATKQKQLEEKERCSLTDHGEPHFSEANSQAISVPSQSQKSVRYQSEPTTRATSPTTTRRNSVSSVFTDSDDHFHHRAARKSGFRLMMGGLDQKKENKRPSLFALASGSSLGGVDSAGLRKWQRDADIVIEFAAEVELGGKAADMVCSLTVVRKGNAHAYLDVHFDPEDAVYKQGVDYVMKTPSLVFGPGETSKEIEIQLLPDCKQAGYLKVNLREPESSVLHGNKMLSVALGQNRHAYLVVAKDPEARVSKYHGAGLITFGTDVIEVPMGRQEKHIQVPVFRLHAIDSVASCCYRTESLDAIPGYDYLEDYGNINFMKGQAVILIDIVLLPKKGGEVEDHFQIILDKPSGAVTFDPFDDGGIDSGIVTVTMQNTRMKEGLPCLYYCFDCLFNIDFLSFARDQWKDQIISACFVGGDAEAQRDASIGAWSLHFAVIPWKLFYGIFCPPPLWSWPCLCCCLLHIAFLTAFIYDLAELLGCIVDMDDRVTAITIVALGTSLPDLFASKTAALHDEYADASIVNVTGSNAVNVFLGIGLSWSLGAIYWHFKGTTDKWTELYGHLGHAEGAFVVIKGTLSYSVIVFILAAVVCLLILYGRRRAFGGELGGPRGAKLLTSLALVGLWVAYVILTVWNASAERSSADQTLAIICALAVTGGFMLFTGIVLNLIRALTVEIHSRVSQKSDDRNPSFYEEEKRKLLMILKKLFPKTSWIDNRSSQELDGYARASRDEWNARGSIRGSFLSAITAHTWGRRFSVQSIATNAASDNFGPMLDELQYMRSELQNWTARLEYLEQSASAISPSPQRASARRVSQNNGSDEIGENAFGESATLYGSELTNTVFRVGGSAA